MSITEEAAADQASSTPLDAVRERVQSGEPFTATALIEQFGLDKRVVWDLINRMRREGHKFQERPTGYKNQKEMRWTSKGEPEAKRKAGRPRSNGGKPNVRSSTADSTPTAPIPSSLTLGSSLVVTGLRLKGNRVIATVTSGRNEYDIPLNSTEG